MTDLKPVDALVEQAIADGAFPGACYAVGRNGEVRVRAFGRYMYCPDSRAVDEQTMWDLASVSKVVGCTTTTMSQLPKSQRRHLATLLTTCPLPVLRDRGWNYAEVTAGGVPMAEVDFRTMASRKCPSLHLAGEILDVDGRIGGFNFQWAWATGHLAGHAAALSL